MAETRNKKKIIFFIIVAAVAGMLVYLFFLRPTNRRENAVIVSGNIEVTDVQISFKIAGRVEARLVDEGQFVKQGQVIAKLDDTDLVQQVEIRRAQVESSQARLSELETGSRPQEIQQAAAAVATAEAELTDAESNFTRLDRLKQKEVVGAQEYVTAKARYDAAQARVKEAKERYSLIKEGPRKEVIEQARALNAQSKASLELAKIQLSYAILRSPITGVVLSKNIEAGEYVVPGTPIITVGDLVNVWLRAYINETDLGRVKQGQKVHVTTDTYPGKVYNGYVSFISSEAEFTPKNVQTQEQRVKLVYRIKIDIKNPNMELKAGMPADAEILLTDVK